MHKEQLQEARTNPEFLKYLEKTKTDAISTKNISALYEVLDSFLDIDETKINEVYKNILQITFDEVQIIIDENKKLNLEDDNLFYVRAFYEHAIEKWSYNNFDGAKNLLFVLSNILDDDILLSSLNAHLIALSTNTSLDNFYKKDVNLETYGDNETYGYFITEFNYDLKEYLELNKETLKKSIKN